MRRSSRSPRSISASRGGEFVSFIGPSGCGKTTLLRVIADLERQTEGEITVNGVSPSEARLARAYGYVFQAPALYPWRTVVRNVTLPLEIMGLAGGERERAARQVSRHGRPRRASSASFPGSSPAACSSACRSPARSASSRKLLLMDEPFGALDEITRDHLNEQLLGCGSRPARP